MATKKKTHKVVAGAMGKVTRRTARRMAKELFGAVIDPRGAKKGAGKKKSK